MSIFSSWVIRALLVLRLKGKFKPNELLTISLDSRPHTNRTKTNCGEKIAYIDRIVKRFRTLVYLADSVDSIRPFLTHAVTEFGKSKPLKHYLSSSHVVLWTDLHNSSYIYYCTPSTTHVGGFHFRLCVTLDFTVETTKTTISELNDILSRLCSTL